MSENQTREMWPAVYIPKEGVARKFTSEKTGKEYAEIVLPEKLPAGAPKIGGWHFYMPAGCVREAKSGDFRVSFPPAWGTIRFLSPYVKGQHGETMEFPVADAMALLEDSFAKGK